MLIGVAMITNFQDLIRAAPLFADASGPAAVCSLPIASTPPPFFLSPSCFLPLLLLPPSLPLSLSFHKHPSPHPSPHPSLPLALLAPYLSPSLVMILLLADSHVHHQS